MSRNTRKDYEEAERQLTELVSGNLSGEQLARAKEMTTYMQNMYNFTSANPMNNATQRDIATEAYKNAYNYILTGDNSPANLGAIKGTSNIFGGRTHRESVSDAASVFRDTFTAPEAGSSNAKYAYDPYTYYSKVTGSPTGSSKSSTDNTAYTDNYVFTWDKGLDNVLKNDTTTYQDLVTSFKDQVLQNLNGAIQAKTAGNYIVGADNLDLEGLRKRVEQIDATQDKFNVLETIGKIVRDFGGSVQQLKTYFGNLYPLLTDAEKRRNTVAQTYTIGSNSGYGTDFDKYLSSWGYHIASKDGKNYLFDTNWNLVTTPTAYINTNYLDKDNYKKGYVVTNNGQVVYGDMMPYYQDVNSPYYAQIKAFVDSLHIGDRLHTNSYSYTSTGNELADEFADNLAGRSVADMSGYFQSNNPILATIKDDNWEAGRSDFEHVQVNNPDITYYWKDKEGQYKTGNYDALQRSLGNITDFTSTRPLKSWDNWNNNDWIEEWNDLHENGNPVIGHQDVSGRSSWGANNKHWSHTFKELASQNQLWCGHGLDNVRFDRDVEAKDAVAVAQLLLQLVGDQSLRGHNKYTQAMYNNWWVGMPQRTMAFIRNTINSHPGEFFTGDHKRELLITWKELLKTHASTQIKKQGGILMAQSGSTATKIRQSIKSSERTQKEIQERADSNNRTLKEQLGAEGTTGIFKGDWTAADSLRMTALAADIASVISAGVGVGTAGVGNVAGWGLGIGSTILDAVADFTDDSVTSKDAWKNLGINAGLTVGAGLGAKSVSVVRKLVKWLPRIINAAALTGYVMDDNTATAAKHITSGNWDMQDLRQILRLVKVVTGIGQTHLQTKAAKKWGQEMTDNHNQNVAALQKSDRRIIKSGNESLDVSKETAASFTKALNEGKKDGAIKVLTDAGFTSEQAQAAVNTTYTREHWYNLRKKKENYSAEVSPDIANQKDAMLKSIEEAEKFSKYSLFNPKADALLASERAQGREFKTLEEMKAFWSKESNLSGQVKSSTASPSRSGNAGTSTAAPAVSKYDKPNTPYEASLFTRRVGQRNVSLLDGDGKSVTVRKPKNIGLADGEYLLAREDGTSTRMKAADILAKLNQGEWALNVTSTTSSTNRQGGTINFRKLRTYA